MGINSDGILFYGVIFTEEESRPDFIEDLLTIKLPDDEPEYRDLMTFTDFVIKDLDLLTHNDDNYNYNTNKLAFANYPVEEILHCSYDFSMYGYGLPETYMRASRGNPISFNFPKVHPARKQQFIQWFTKYNFEAKPQWHLTSLYG